MTTLFNRAVRFEVGKPGEDGFRFELLRMEFSVAKSSDSNANPGRISIYNLSKATRDRLNDEGLVYNLEAGYYGIGEPELVKTLSAGDVLDISSVRNGVDVVTTFKLGEGTKALAEKTLDKSFSEGVSTRQLVTAFSDALGVAQGTLKGIKDQIFNSGYSATGKIKDRLDELTEKQGLEWSIQNDELQIIPKEGSTDEEAVLLTKETGLLKAFREKATKNGKEQLQDIVKFSALLNPDIKVGRKIAIFSEIDEIGQSPEVPGIFTVRKVTYSGDNRDGKFSCEGEAI